jgi:hypothetical protein
MLRPKFNNADVEKMVRDQLTVIDNAVFNRLVRVGEQFIINSRNNHTYKDRTGNLTASVGYAIIKNSDIIKATLTNPDAVKMFEDAANDYPFGYVLIGVAHMNYAAAVESKNFDVITSSALQAKRDLEKSLQELKDKLNK